MSNFPMSRAEAISLGRIDPAASGWWAYLKGKAAQALAAASEVPKVEDASRVIRVGRVLSNGCGR